MGRRMAGLFCLAGFLAGSVALAQDFSADMVDTKPGHNQGPNKMYSTKDKIRFEVEGRNPAMGPTSLILDEASGKMILLMSARHMYMDSVPQMMKPPVISQLWHVQDVNDACPQWKRVVEQMNSAKNWGTCTKVGSETLNGRSTVKYEGTSTNGDKSTVWVDTKLKCAIKLDNGSGGGMELKNIQEGSQPTSLFEVPAGYTKFDINSMMRQQPQ